MGAFSTTKCFPFVSDTNLIIKDLDSHFKSQGYEFVCEPLNMTGWHVSLRKGGIFKSVLGLKTSLNVEIVQSNASINVTASVGIFGQQVLPSVITWFVAWPVIITQIWGLIQQSKLDDEVMVCIENSINNHNHQSSYNNSKCLFCVECGFQITADFTFCPKCGTKIIE